MFMNFELGSGENSDRWSPTLNQGHPLKLRIHFVASATVFFTGLILVFLFTRFRVPGTKTIFALGMDRMTTFGLPRSVATQAKSLF